MVKRNFSLTYDGTVEDKINAIQCKLQLNSKAKTIIACIEKVYAEIFDGQKDDEVNIVTDYKGLLNNLRVEAISLTNQLISSSNKDKAETITRLSEVKASIGLIKELTRLDGDVNNIFFSAKDFAKHMIDVEGNEIKREKTEVEAEKFNHKVTMDYIEKAGEKAELIPNEANN